MFLHRCIWIGDLDLLQIPSLVCFVPGHHHQIRRSNVKTNVMFDVCVMVATHLGRFVCILEAVVVGAGVGNTVDRTPGIAVGILGIYVGETYRKCVG